MEIKACHRGQVKSRLSGPQPPFLRIAKLTHKMPNLVELIFDYILLSFRLLRHVWTKDFRGPRPRNKNILLLQADWAFHMHEHFKSLLRLFAEEQCQKKM